MGTAILISIPRDFKAWPAVIHVNCMKLRGGGTPLIASSFISFMLAWITQIYTDAMDIIQQQPNSKKSSTSQVLLKKANQRISCFYFL